MNYEEKLIRYIASKLIQRRHFMNKGEFLQEKKLAQYINRVLEQLKDEYKDLKHIRIKSKTGLITPAIAEVVSKIKFNGR